MKGNKSIKRYLKRLNIRLFGKEDSKVCYYYCEIEVIPQYNKNDTYLVSKYFSYHTDTSWGRFSHKVRSIRFNTLKKAKEWIEWDKNKPSIKVIKQ